MLILLGSLLFLLIPIIYLVSLFKPKTFGIRTAKNPDGKWSRGKFTLYTLIAWIISFVIIASGLDETESTESAGESEKVTETTQVEEKSDEVAEVAETEQVEEEPTLGLTVKEFGQRYNAKAKEMDLSDQAKIDWSDVEIKEGAVNDTFTKMIRDDVALTGVVSKNGELKSLTYMLGKTQQGEVAFLTTLIVSGVTAGTLNPDLPKDQTVEVASNLLMDAVKSYAENSDGVSESVQVEDVRYGVSINEMTGVWMFFEAKKD